MKGLSREMAEPVHSGMCSDCKVNRRYPCTMCRSSFYEKSGTAFYKIELDFTDPNPYIFTQYRCPPRGMAPGGRIGNSVRIGSCPATVIPIPLFKGEYSSRISHCSG